MSRIRGAKPASLRRLVSDIQRQSGVVVAQEVAARAAPEVTALALAEFDAGRTAYGDPRPEGVDGRELRLVRTGATRAALRFVAVGTVIRCVLGPRYARYLVGKYRILPSGQQAVPFRWRRAISDVARDVVSRRIESVVAPLRRAS